MKSCEPQTQQLLAEQPGYQQAVHNLKSDCPAAGNPWANIPVAIEQAIKEACDADLDRPFTEIVEDHQTIRRPDAYPARNPPDETPLRRVVALTRFLHRHFLPGPEEPANYWSTEAQTNLFEAREAYRQMLKSKPKSLGSELFHGTTGKLGAPTWWTFPEVGCPAPADAATYMEELMLDPQSIDDARREGGVVILIPPQLLADQAYKPCALDAFWEDTSFRPDHSERPYGMTCPARPELKGHPELISRSYSYSDWQSRLEKIDLEWLEPSVLEPSV
ncbi:hypothetical protein [Candidatus Thiosymbion oneisti]|uniref:hypothetical protein n=1 Tax=Candidatus Thiosymbion oneisti TaxID=589554 RepID=UPI000B7EFB16|nr:hypothetical protein [Candidatus Thiosymbion oneisti]